jgi:hypothetical protein
LDEFRVDVALHLPRPAPELLPLRGQMATGQPCCVEQASKQTKIRSSSQLCPFFPLSSMGATVARLHRRLPRRHCCRTTSLQFILPISNFAPLSLLSLHSPLLSLSLSSRVGFPPPLSQRKFSAFQRPPFAGAERRRLGNPLGTPSIPPPRPGSPPRDLSLGAASTPPSFRLVSDGVKNASTSKRGGREFLTLRNSAGTPRSATCLAFPLLPGREARCRGSWGTTARP